MLVPYLRNHPFSERKLYRSKWRAKFPETSIHLKGQILILWINVCWSCELQFLWDGRSGEQDKHGCSWIKYPPNLLGPSYHLTVFAHRFVWEQCWLCCNLRGGKLVWTHSSNRSVYADTRNTPIFRDVSSTILSDIVCPNKVTRNIWIFKNLFWILQKYLSIFLYVIYLCLWICSDVRFSKSQSIGIDAPENSTYHLLYLCLFFKLLKVHNLLSLIYIWTSIEPF